MTREHAQLLACACVAILLLGLQIRPGARSALEGRDANSARDETATDAILQQAATAALGQREGAVIVIDAHTGRVRAIVNRDAAFATAMMPGSTMKPFTALAAL